MFCKIVVLFFTAQLTNDFATYTTSAKSKTEFSVTLFSSSNAPVLFSLSQMFSFNSAPFSLFPVPVAFSWIALSTKVRGKEVFLTHFLDNLLLHKTWKNPKLLKIFENAM